MQLQDFPPEHLIITQYQSRYKWYVRDGKTRTYLPKSQKLIAEILAKKKYLSLKLEELENEKDAISLYLKHHSKSSNKSDQLLSNAPYFTLLKTHFSSKLNNLLEWSSSPYEQNTSHPEHLIHKSLSMNLVRSKSEAIIDTSLFRNHIPFRYECLLELCNTSLYPDFTILHPRTEKIYYWEHFGMMDNPTYAKNAFSKLQIYYSNNIIPSENLIATFETKNAPLNMDFVEKIVASYFL